MKVLMITPYVTINTRPEFSKNKTGFGYMVMDIAKAVGELEQVEVFATDTLGRSFISDGVCFLKRSLWNYILSLFSCLPLFSIIRLRREYAMKSGTFARLICYWLMTGHIRKTLKDGKYDIIHIHGCGFSTELWMQVCNNCEHKFVVTLHGLNSFSDKVTLEPAGKKYERDFISKVINGIVPITVISTGMKRVIEKTYDVSDRSNIKVVCNSFSFVQDNNTMSIREIYNIPKSAKVLLYIGNISKNKNQEQMVRAFGLLPSSMRKQTYVLFCGEDSLGNGELERNISICPDGSHLILCGSVEKSMISSYYIGADGVVLLSYTEGFGLSLVEGLHFGLPCVMPNDLDAFDDIFDECAVVSVRSREDEAVSRAIEILISRDWNKERIVAYSKKFEHNVMAKKYLLVYYDIIEGII